MMDHRAMEDDTATGAYRPRCDSYSPNGLQLDIMKDNYQYYHAWQPSSFESLDDEYYDDAIANLKNDGGTNSSNILLVKDLPSNMNNDSMKDFFSLFGTVTDTTLSRGDGTVTFEDSEGAEKALAARPIKIFGETVDVYHAAKNDARQGRRLPRRSGPFPIVVALPNFGPLHQDLGPSRKKNAMLEQSSHGDAKEFKGIFNKATQALASAATKFQPPTPDQLQANDTIASSAPPALSPLQKKASLHSLLTSPTEDPLFDDDEHFMGESVHRLGPNGIDQSDGANRSNKRAKHFHSDNALISWIWAPGQQSSQSSQAEYDLSCVLIRGRAVHAKLPLLASTSAASTCCSSVNASEANGNKQSWLDNTNINLLHKPIGVLVKKQNSTNHRHGGVEKNETEMHETSDIGIPSRHGPYTLYQARHPCLAPLISVTKCTVSEAKIDQASAYDNDSKKEFESIVSVFDITPSRHRSLHDLLRTEDFLTRPLYPGLKGHEKVNLADPFTTEGLSWFGDAGDQNDGFCRCHISSERDGQRNHQNSHVTMSHSRSVPNLQQEDEKSKNETNLHSIHFLGDLRKLGEEGAAMAARAIAVDQPPPKFMRRRRHWKLLKVGSCYRANVADLRIRFLALQLFKAVQFCHSKGVTMGEQLSPDKIFVQDDGWVRLVLPVSTWKAEINAPIEKMDNDSQTSGDVLTDEKASPRRQWRSIFRNGSLQSDKIGSEGEQSIVPYPGYGDAPTVQWQRGQLTNLCYLMMLNAAAGRTVGDHANPPIFPWVTDFSGEIDLGRDLGTAESPWRDLSMSKFRLKKGDEQLDQTFLHASPKHHIPEALCELTYTVYRARSLPIHHLRKNVRNDFIAAEYPNSIKNIYDWTPDEATLEFYAHNVQPSIFRSIHDGMDDLELPPWCKDDPGNFISYHRRLLESDHVTRQLHLWIDINFGECLTGNMAVAEKNLALSSIPWGSGGCQDQCEGNCQSVFTGSTTDLKNSVGSRSRFVQLFAGPHPRKHSELRKSMSSALRTTFSQREKKRVDNSNDIHLPPSNAVDDFQTRKERDLSAIGTILRDCYCSARVIPPSAVDEAIDKLMMGTLDIQQSLTDLTSDGPLTKSSFPFPRQLNNAYQILSTVQSLTFQRQKKDLDYMEENQSTSLSTNLQQVWRLIQSSQCLESISSAHCSIILPTLISPFKTIDPLIENCIGSYYSSFTDKFHKYLIVLSQKIISSDLITPLLFKFFGALINSHIHPAIAEDCLGKLLLSRSLIHSLYSSSHGMSFVSQVTSFAIKQLRFQQPTTPKEASLQMRSLPTLFISLLAQDDMLGAAICCKYVVPDLMHNIEKSSIINQQNMIVQTLKSLLPLIPQDAVGILICKPILRSIIPVQLSRGSGRAGPNECPKSSRMKSFRFLKDLMILLQNCLCHMDSKAIVKYYLHSIAGTISLLISKSFEAIPEMGSSLDESPLEDNPSEALLREANILVCDIISRIDERHHNEIFPVVERFCSQVNDSYLSLALHQSVTGQSKPHDAIDDVMSLPGIASAHMISREMIGLCGRNTLELSCPSALELLAWLNQARGVHSKPSLPPPGPESDRHTGQSLPQRSSSFDDNLHDIVGGDAFEMRAPKRQIKPPSSALEEMEGVEPVLRDTTSYASISNGSTRNDINHTSQSPNDQDAKSQIKQSLAWVLGLHKVERDDRIRYLWQPRMMLSTVLKLENDNDGKNASITSMAADDPESMLAAGNSKGELLLFDLRRHPPVLKHKKQLCNDNGMDKSPVRQVEFFDHDGNVLACNGGLHLYDTNSEEIVSSLSPENTFRRNGDEHKKFKWKGDNFIGFSLFPQATGLEEILGGASREFAAISSSHLYTIDVRCRDSAVNCYNMLWPEDAHHKALKLDPFRALSWNITSLPREEHTKKHKSVHVRDDNKTTFDLTCVTTHTDWICTGSRSGHIHCFDRRGKLLSCWKGHAKSVEYLKAVSRHRLLSVSGDKTAVTWDMAKTPPQKIGSIYNIPGKECAINATSHQFDERDGLVSIPGGSNLLLCAAAGRKAVFMPMPQEPHQANGSQDLVDVLASRIVMSDFEGNRIPSSGKLNISSLALLPCRQLVLLGSEEIQVCL